MGLLWCKCVDAGDGFHLGVSSERCCGGEPGAWCHRAPLGDRMIDAIYRKIGFRVGAAAFFKYRLISVYY